MLRSLSEMGRILGLLPLAGVMLRVLCSGERSVHFSLVASDIRIPVSFSVCSNMAVRFPHEAISWSISASVGMNGSRFSGMKRRFIQGMFRNLRSASYVTAHLRHVSLFQVMCVAKMVFTCSGFLRSAIFASCLRSLVREVIVASALPFCLMSIAKFMRSWVVSGLHAGPV